MAVATPELIARWVPELVRTWPWLVRSYLPGSPISPRTRERVILAVTERNGCRYTAWIHGAWRDFLGDVAEADAEEALLAYARACAEAGEPLPSDDLLAVIPTDAVAVVRATVAQTELANLVGMTVDGAWARLSRRRPFDPVALARELAIVAVSLPIAVPMIATAGGLRAVHRLAPPLPEVVGPDADDANLLAHLLTSALPTYLANALVRLVVLGLLPPVAIGVRAGRTSATVRLGRAEVVVANGIAGDAAFVVEGDVEPLLRFATGSLANELRSIRLRGA